MKSEDLANLFPGETVTWLSHSNGRTYRHFGLIIAVLAPREEPVTALARHGLKIKDFVLCTPALGYPRKIGSILVASMLGKKSGRPNLYWPVLKRVDVDDSEKGHKAAEAARVATFKNVAPLKPKKPEPQAPAPTASAEPQGA